MNGKLYDKARTDVLNKYGLKVIRFSDADIDNNFDGVCREIDEAIKKAINK